MGAYLCNECDRLFDSHEVICWEDPQNRLELICEDCHQELYDEDGNLIER